MKGLGYIRVSTDEQANEGISLQNQVEKIKAYCMLNDIELVDIIEDAGKSGKNLKRDGVKSLIAQVKDKHIDSVIVYKLDRLSRKVVDTLMLIETFEKSNIAFHSIMEKIDTKTAMGKFFLNITASLAQMERDLISERTKDALQSKINRNERAGQIPYGWELSRDGNNLIKKEEEQKIIRFIKRLRNKGNGLKNICKALTEKGYKPLGKKWYPQTIKNILKKVS